MSKQNRKYLVTWGKNFATPGSKILGHEFFTDDNEYTEENRRQLLAMKPGDVWVSEDYPDHIVQLLPSFTDTQNAMFRVIEMAQDHLEDIESGIDDGTYLASDNQDLELKRNALDVMFTHAMLSIEAGVSISDVAYWDSPAYNQGADGHAAISKPYRMTVIDQRESNGQLYVDMETKNGDDKNVLSGIFEVNRLVGSDVDQPCMHLHFNPNELAASFFKERNGIVMRLETGVTVLDTILPDGQYGMFLEART